MGAKNLRGMKQEEAEVEDCDEGNMDNIWGITVKDVEDEVKVVREEEPDNNIDSISIHVPDVTNDVIQPLIPQTIHTTPPDKDYVALGTKPIFDELWKNSEMRSLEYYQWLDEVKAEFNPLLVDIVKNRSALILLFMDREVIFFTEIKGAFVVS
ncbi:hypothetical protein Tco_0822394 [Tanacetum coccineum]|uniref:Uncharacterized protein n=1 Tax=Tanacetum coccineum TaxID=301880 RepID=A0ABQ5AEX2_9ASTR